MYTLFAEDSPTVNVHDVRKPVRVSIGRIDETPQSQPQIGVFGER